MRKRAIAASIASSGAIILVGWSIGSHSQATQTSAVAPLPAPSNAAAAPPPSATTAPQSTPTAAASLPDPATTSAPTSQPAPSQAATASTFAGSSVSTRYGNVQVQITVEAGKITDVTPLHLTNDGGRSVQISNQAAPILRQEVLAAQSANVDAVSGATYTSDGYLKSLQSALDQAGL